MIELTSLHMVKKTRSVAVEREMVRSIVVQFQIDIGNNSATTKHPKQWCCTPAAAAMAACFWAAEQSRDPLPYRNTSHQVGVMD